MNGILNFLTWLSDNWTMVLMCVVIVISLAHRAKVFFSKSKEEQVKIALEQVRLGMLDLVTEAEKTYGSGTGTLKRSQVIQKVFERYPILSKVTSVDSLTIQLDKMINDSLSDMRKLLESNESFQKLVLGNT
jgi:hypothetical protein